MTAPHDRPRPREAGPELLVLAHWEAFVPWLLEHCARWPKSARFSLTQRLENHALDVLELLIVARYQPAERAAKLRQANLALERMRFLCRIARSRRFMSTKAFEKASAVRCVTAQIGPVRGLLWRARLEQSGRHSGDCATVVFPGLLLANRARRDSRPSLDSLAIVPM